MYIESVTDSHDYEFPSDNEDNSSPIYDEETIDHNQVCMIFGSSKMTRDKDLPLIHPCLINWGQEGFPYDDHRASYAVDLDKTPYFGEASSSLNHNSDDKVKHIIVALLVGKERSKLLVEEIEEMSIRNDEKVRNIHLAKPLGPVEKGKFINFFKKRSINFAWSYADMSGLDPKLILHHLPLLLGVKP